MKRCLVLLLLCSAPQACAPNNTGCLDNPNKSCVPASPCAKLAPDVCEDTAVSAFVLSQPGERPTGVDGAGAMGDLVLKNARLTVVIEAVDHPSALAVSGGHILDIAPAGGDDQITQISTAVGILPRDAVAYEEVHIGEVTNEMATVIARGHLDGDERVQVFTRYELRACDTGLRIRTELYNGGRIAQAVYLTDAYFWGNRSMTPFVPTSGGGFKYPPLDLVEIDQAFRSFPFLSAQSHIGARDSDGKEQPEHDGSYAVVACDRRALSGFNTGMLSAAGIERTVVMPGDGVAFERVIFSALGRGSSGAQQLALAARAQMFNESFVKVKGSARFANQGMPSGAERELSLLFVEGDVDTGTPWAEAVPGTDGRYEVSLPPNRTYSVLVESFGAPVAAPSTLEVGDLDETFILQDLARPGRMEIFVRRADTLNALDAEVVLVPTATSTATSGSTYGIFGDCTPYLGPPHGASPACNRVLVREGYVRFQVPPGEYWAYVTHGFGWSLRREKVLIESDRLVRLNVDLDPLPIFPEGSVGADFHVHGGRSFDTSIPDETRVLSFLATGLDVLAATDHDVVGSYTAELERIDASDRLFVIPAVEMTGLVLFYHRQGSSVPRTLGHFNFWPMSYDPLMARNGAPWDERMEPAELYETMRPLIGPDGVAQLNHPYAESLLGRDEGYARAIGYDVRKPVSAAAETPEGQWNKRANGGTSNLGHDTQEVMNGGSVQNFLEYRALWLSFLRQGIVRAGTANSDSHTLNIEQVGYPRNIVLGDFHLPNIDLPSFNQAVKHGRMVGTNGPMIDVHVRDSLGVDRGPSIDAFTPARGASFIITLKAAPWVPVEELRVLVNGTLVRTIDMSVMTLAADPFGKEGIIRYQGEIAVQELLTTDGFVHFEAGLRLPEAKDLLDDDGVIDTLDYNGDGAIDDADKDAAQRAYPVRRARENELRFHVDAVSPGVWTEAFTNPFLLDMAGDGWEAPGL